MGNKRVIKKGYKNNGIDVNAVSEAVVQAVEKVHKVPKGKQGHVNKELAKKALKIDAEKTNSAMANGKGDNTPVAEEEQREHDRITVNQENMDEEDTKVLASLATLVVENEDDALVETIPILTEATRSPRPSVSS